VRKKMKLQALKNAKGKKCSDIIHKADRNALDPTQQEKVKEKHHTNTRGVSDQPKFLLNLTMLADVKLLKGLYHLSEEEKIISHIEVQQNMKDSRT